MRTYIREVVSRYVNSPAIWGWEFGNEYNLPADLPNAADHRPPIVTSPVNTITVRAYDAKDDLGRLSSAMAMSRQLKKPLFVGEFGVPGPDTAEARKQFAAILTCIETNQVSVAALWVYDFKGQDSDWKVTSANGRAWQLLELQKLTQRMNTRRFK